MPYFRSTWNWGRDLGVWEGGAAKLMRPGKVWVREAGVWVPVIAPSVGYQFNYGDLLNPDIQMDWYLLFRDIQPTGTPGSVVIGRDDNGLQEAPGDPGKTANVGWTNGGGYDPDYDQVQVDWYRNTVMDHSTFHSPSAGQGHSQAVYHHAASDLSYPADSLYATLRYYNSDASPAKKYGPTATTSVISY